MPDWEAREAVRNAKWAKPLSCIKIILLVGLTLYLWMTAAGNRNDSLALLRTLEARGMIKFETEEKKSETTKPAKKNQYEEVSAEVKAFAKGTPYEKILEGKDGKGADGKPIEK